MQFWMQSYQSLASATPELAKDVWMGEKIRIGGEDHYNMMLLTDNLK